MCTRWQPSSPLLPPPPPLSGCGLDFHKRCAFQLPNNCSRARRQVSTSFSLFPPRRPHTRSLSNQAGGGSLEEVSNIVACSTRKERQVTFSSTDNVLTLPIWPLDQHDQALLQASVLGGAPGLAGGRVRRQEQGPGASHLPHPQLHQTHRLPVLPPAAQRALQTGAAVLRWDGRRTSCWSGVKVFHQQKCMI